MYDGIFCCAIKGRGNCSAYLSKAVWWGVLCRHMLSVNDFEELTVYALVGAHSLPVAVLP